MTAPHTDQSIYDAIVRFNADREPDLVERKLKRIDESVFTFYRGTDHLFGQAWPALKPADPGPAVLSCGDLHLENFGAYQTEVGDFRFDINDFDEALVAPCSFDLVRCAASILLAGEEWGLHFRWQPRRLCRRPGNHPLARREAGREFRADG